MAATVTRNQQSQQGETDFSQVTGLSRNDLSDCKATRINKENNMTSHPKTRVRALILLAAFTLAVCGLALTLDLLARSPLALAPVSAQNLPRAQTDPCSFTAITVTADLGDTYRVSDTLPGSVDDRIVYFANHEPGVVTITVAVSHTAPISCHVWGGAAFGRTTSEFLLGTENDRRWLTYPVSIADASATLVLTSSSNITGLLLPPHHEAVLTFTQDVTPPQDAHVTAPEHTVETVFPVHWSAWDEDSGVVSYTAEYSGTAYTAWQEWQIDTITMSGTLAIGTFSAKFTDASYIFRITAYDHVGHNTRAQAETFVGPFSATIYLPLVVRSYPPQPVGSVDIDGEPDNVYRPSVTLILSAAVDGDDVIEMRLHNENTNWYDDDWETFTSTKTWPLASGDSGLRTVYVQFRGRLGGVSNAVSAQVYLSQNGDFEDGTGQTAWQKTENPLLVSVVQDVQERSGGSTPPASGDYAALLGNPNYSCSGVPLGYAAIEQTFSLPVNTDKLAFKYIIWSQDASISNQFDRFEVYVGNNMEFSDGNQFDVNLGCSNWRRVPGPENIRNGQTSGWTTEEVDLSAYVGQTVVVSFRNYSRFDNWYNTYTYIDDVTITGNW